jgi:cytochrome oxidase Cu insertion factor (SCO1/SenC/PrrC family)
MRKPMVLICSSLILALAVTACAAGIPNTGQGATQTASAMMMANETSTSAAMMHTTPTGEMMASSATPAAMMHGTSTPDDMMPEANTPDTMMSESATPDTMMPAATGENAMAGWLSAQLTDTQGKSFSLSDYKGKVVLVELMAVWCTTCKAQQDQIQALHTKPGMPDTLVTVSLDIDPNEDAAALKNYVSAHKFDWSFAVAPKTSAHEIGALYGDQFLNPPSAPVLIVDAHGQVHPLPFGVKSADDLQKQLEPLLKDAM